MNFKKTTILCFLVVCITINVSAVKRKAPKIKKAPKIVSQPCGCKKPGLIDILNCGCRGPIIEPALAPFSPLEIAIPACQTPIIDIPNYRYADPIEINPLGCLFPSIEIPNYGLLSAPMSLPSVEYFAAVDLPCGCPGPKCGCRAPAVKLPAYPREFLAAIDVPNCGCASCQGLIPPFTAPVIELPSYGPAPLIPVSGGCRNGCSGPCSCPEIQILPCGCSGTCGCPEIQILPCGCSGACACPEIQILGCGCQGACSCGIPMSSCGCQGPCSCPEIQVLSCGCQGSCSCSGVPVSSCGCPGPCGCPAMPVGLLPAVELPSCGCGCGLPGCNCGKYLRQVTLQPPFM